MQNTYMDLHNHLMCEIERLNNDDLTAEELELEVQRAKAMVDIADSATELGRMQIEAFRVAGEYNYSKKEMPLLLGGNNAN